MEELRQNTPTTRWLGPFKSTDGLTSTTGLTVTYYIAKNSSDFVSTTGTNSESTQLRAWYKCPMTSDNLDTLGVVTISAQSSSQYLDVWQTYAVVTANYWDSKYGSDTREVDVIAVLGSTSDADDYNTFLAGVNIASIVTSTSAADEMLNMFDGTGYVGGAIRLKVDWTETNGSTYIDGKTPATWAQELFAKGINDSYKDSNEYKYYTSTGGYLFSINIATTSRTRSS